MLKLFNTATGKEQDFVSLQEGKAGMYTCGMTVYDYAHIGHGRKYVGDDILRRTLEWLGYEVNHVQNVTDVGHLSSDEDDGEDKIEKGAVKAGKTVWEVAEFFTDHFYHSMDVLNIKRPSVICKATDHIPEQIALVQTLLDKGFAYDTPEAVYFDIAAFPEYGALLHQKLSEKKVAARDEVQTGEFKKNPHDFVLWFKRVGRFANHTMHWESPWGEGFPGWHLECSAMSMKYLGETFDIHTGGIDHIPVHHTNEIAQSEAATGKTLANYWIHHAFLTVDGTKMSKSLDNYITIDEVMARGYDPMVLRFFYLSAHYRQQLNFTWEALAGAKAGYHTLCTLLRYVVEKKEAVDALIDPHESTAMFIETLRQEFAEAMTDDLNVTKALAVVFECLKHAKDESKWGSVDYKAIYAEIMAMDQVLGLDLDRVQPIEYHIPQEVQDIVDQREIAREQKNWEESDRLRDVIIQFGFIVEDTSSGPVVRPV